MPQDISGYDVGALLYCPANAHHTVAQAVAAVWWALAGQ